MDILLERLLAMKAGIPNDPRMLTQYTDRSFLLSEFEGRIEHMNDVNKKPYKISQSTSPGFRSSVSVQMTPANRVDISTLGKNTDKILEGKYFLCRTLAPPIKMTAILTIVEDPKGQHGIRLALYNYSTSNSRIPEVILQDLPVAQILAIKNPWFKSSMDGGFGVHCDNPADVLLVSESLSQELLPGVKWEGEIPTKWQKFVKSPPQSAIDWKNEGNRLFVAQKYQKAIQCYTEGLNLKDDAGESDAQVTFTCDMMSNRAAAYLSLNCFQNALADVNKLLEIDPIHIKGLYRKGKALLGLQRFEEAIKFLKTVGNLKYLDTINRKLFSEMLKLAEILLKQQKTGEYDIVELHKAGEIRHTDCADFAGPVKVQKIVGRERGLVATQDIEPGQLISATKAFVVIFPVEGLGPGEHVEAEFNANIGTNLVNFASHRKLVEGIAQKLTLEPSLCREVYQLYAGPDLTIFDENRDADHLVDMKRIDAICTFNSFDRDMSLETRKTEATHLHDHGASSGLWIFPSFFNHSCWDSNALWTTFGDMLFVRAFKKILQGEEILIPYESPTEIYPSRAHFMKILGFVCECRLCQVDRDSSAEGRKRADLLKKVYACYKNKDAMNHDGDWEQKYVDFMMTWFKNIWDLDKEGQNPNLKVNPSLGYPLIELAQYYFKPNEPEFNKSIDLLTKCYDLTINSPLKELAVQTCVNLIAAHLAVGNLKEAKKWIETSKKEVLIFYGTSDMDEEVMNDTLALMLKYKYFLDHERAFCNGNGDQ